MTALITVVRGRFLRWRWFPIYTIGKCRIGSIFGYATKNKAFHIGQIFLFGQVVFKRIVI